MSYSKECSQEALKEEDLEKVNGGYIEFRTLSGGTVVYKVFDNQTHEQVAIVSNKEDAVRIDGLVNG